MSLFFHFVIIVLLNCSAHDFHLSKSTVNFDRETSTIQVSTHLFIDDLEVALGEGKLKIGTAKEDTLTDVYIADYLEKHFLFVASDTLTHHFLGKEVSEDYTAVWCYFEIPIETSQDITVVNNALMEVFSDQRNLMTFRKSNQRISDKIYDASDFSSTFAIR